MVNNSKRNAEKTRMDKGILGANVIAVCHSMLSALLIAQSGNHKSDLGT